MTTRNHQAATLLITLVTLFGRSVSSAAQGIQTSSIVGSVFDSSGAVVPHAVVTIEGSSLIGGPLALATDASGHYAATAITPGRYVVTVRQTGFDNVRRADIDVPVATTLTVDMVLAPARLVAQVNVSGTATPLVDVRTPAASAHLDQRLLENLPSLRSVADVINLAPGVSASVGFGGTQGSNGLYVDGVNIVDPQLGSPWLRINYEWLEQVEVAAIGAGPEYGNSTGVTANMVLRSGTNRLQGLFDTLTTRPSWLARNTDKISATLQRNFAPLQLINWWDASEQLGGPMLRDRLWYFAGVESLRHAFRPAGYAGDGAIGESDDKAILKLTSALAPSMRLEGLIQPGVYRMASSDLSSQVPPEATTDIRQPEVMWNAQLRWTPSNRWLIEIRNGGYRSDEHDDPHPPVTRNGPSGHIDVLTGQRRVGANFFADFRRTQYLTAISGTTDASTPWGRHDLRMAMEIEHAGMVTALGYPGGMFFQDQGTTPYRVLLWQGGAMAATNRRWSAFANDNWHIRRVTASIGVRTDLHRVSIPLVHDVYETNALAPRIGIAWDMLKGHQLVVRAHAGRYYDQTFLGRLSTLDVSGASPSSTDAIDGSGQYVELSRSVITSTNVAVDPNVKQAFVDQITTGTEWQMRPNVSLEFNLIHRDFRRFTGMVDVARRWSPITQRDPGPNGVADTSDDGDLFTVYNLDLSTFPFYLYENPAGAFRRYRGLQAIAHKRFSRQWQAQASYTWSRTTGTVDNGSHTNTGINDLGTGGAYSNPNRFINNLGRSPYDPREAKILADGVIPAWGGFNLAAVYRYTSGQTWARRAVFRGLNQGVENVWVEPRGSRRLPAIKKLDARVEKVIPLRAPVRVGLSAEVFNVFNQGVPNSDLFAPVQVLSGPTLGAPLAWVDPRLLRINLRLTF